MDKKTIGENFKKTYGREAQSVYFSPGRVNVIGEHTDHNGGCVFPCAISLGTYAAISLRDDRKINLISENFDLRVETSLDDLGYKKSDDWANYPKGVMFELTRRGYSLGGMDILISGDIPNGAGLSSSASIEVVTAVFCNELFDLNIDTIELVKLSQYVENNYIGLNCGIMDQFAVGMGKKNQAILLDCNTLNYEYSPRLLGDYELMIANTNKRRGLADSKYNERRAECVEALKDLQTVSDIKNICDLSKDEFDMICGTIKNPEALKRARHAVYENERVKEAVAFLRNGEIERFAELLNDSHESLENDYEATGFELDSLAGSAQRFSGCAGARMTGAGFGGCTVNIVKKDRAKEFIKEVGEEYYKLTGLKADFYQIQISDGARKL
jgi:galactokinase